MADGCSAPQIGGRKALYCYIILLRVNDGKNDWASGGIGHSPQGSKRFAGDYALFHVSDAHDAVQTDGC